MNVTIEGAVRKATEAAIADPAGHFWIVVEDRESFWAAHHIAGSSGWRQIRTGLLGTMKHECGALLRLIPKSGARASDVVGHKVTDVFYATSVPQALLDELERRKHWTGFLRQRDEAEAKARKATETQSGPDDLAAAPW